MTSFVYIVECADGTFYTGWTNDLAKRLQAHNNKKGAKYTKARVPVKLVYVESFSDKQPAQRREYEIKQLSRGEKLKLVESQKEWRERDELKILKYLSIIVDKSKETGYYK